MSLFAVIREAGPEWASGGIHAQPAVDEHVAFMDGLASDGLVLVAGPLAGSERGRLRVLLIADADGENEILRRLADDPWQRGDRLRTVSVEPWTILIGETLIGNS
jgi:uncharacterized protein YciI